ncbi:LysR substrate-binding domain-containing protein [Variovorax sp. J22P240]|uniref:LysR substrate-binding domain-containing protein n=1 Tax=Variovorax sp. J22P240 TaxID=3053514 RepID=UPI0025751C7A|nr:LysR substrate-binding domain-containing protein [Variovorax sp. J22P240]MDM0000694.1 LysR substrate-binding domain-containing protein [Variovorax sp. J22P240]
MEELGSVVDDLMALVVVVQAGGFSAASRRFGIPVSSLSRRVAALEKQLGVSLLTRGARSFKVTEVGARIYQHGLTIRAETQNAIAAARHSAGEPAGHLRVSCPMALALGLIGPMVIEFTGRHPNVSVTLDSTDGRPPSAFGDSSDLLIVASLQPLRESSLVARKLFDAQYLLVGAPAVHGALPNPASPADLAGCAAIGWTFRSKPACWQLERSDEAPVEVDVQLRMTSDNLLLIQKAALAGVGVAQLPLVMCAQDIEAGLLCVIAPGWRPPTVSIYALYPSRRDLTPAGRCFLDMLVETTQQMALHP